MSVAGRSTHRLALALLLVPPLAWLVVAYLGSLAVLLVSAFWGTEAFTGAVVRTFTGDNVVRVLTDAVFRTATLRTLAQGGIRISLDDFGTGFSSLSYLHQLPLDKVKIDRSFLESIREDERSLILLSGVTHMAADLGLQVVIEGIEEEEQLAILRGKVHVNQAQGYLFGKAMPADAVRQLLREQPVSTVSRQAKAAG